MSDAEDAPTPVHPDRTYLQRATDDLCEHFDSVIIIATKCDVGNTGGTNLTWAQSGNTFANKGAVKEWLTAKNEDTRVQRRPSA